MFLPRLPIIPLLGILQTHILHVTAVGNSVCNEPGFYFLRPCAQPCVGCRDSRLDQIAYKIGCGTGPPNECWCATNMFTLATSALSDCVSRSCTLGVWESDYTEAENFYTSYCERNGFTGVREGEVPVETTTSGTTKATRTQGSTGPTQTGSDSRDEIGEGNGEPQGGDLSGLSRSDKIALGVG